MPMYCLDCATVMVVAGRYKGGYSEGQEYFTCPKCHDTTYNDMGLMPVSPGYWFPPGHHKRCSRCGAYHEYPEPKCRRCGSPNPNSKGQTEGTNVEQPQWGAQPRQPQQGMPAMSFATPTEQPRRGFWNTVFGVFTITTAISLLFTIFGMHIFSPAKIFIVTFWVIHDGIGILGGFLSISGGTFGKLLRKIFWIMLPILIVLALLLGL